MTATTAIGYQAISGACSADGTVAADTFLDSQSANRNNLSVVVGFGF